MNPEELRQRLTLIVAETPVDQCWTLSTTHLLKLVEDAVEAEREACAKVAESYEPTCDSCPSGVAIAIRARGIDGAKVGEVGVWGEWVGLTEADIYDAMDFDDEFEFAHAIEAKLKEKNCG